MRSDLANTPRPFLKWVGGKGQLLPELLERIEDAEPFERYHEPFVGGGALFFELARLSRLGRKKAYLSDSNSRLMDAYQAVQQDVDRLIALLQDHKARHTADPEGHYYAVRAQAPDDKIARGARIIYLNRTCFNGLFRENSRGQFNVPIGRYKNPTICDELNLRAAAEALQKARLDVRPFEKVLKHAKPGDLVYFDPPYHPLSKTSSFTDYNQRGFGEQEQRALADVFRTLTERGVKALLSNSMTPLVQALYSDYQIDRVYAARMVNSRADRRGKIPEALVRNF